MQETHIYITGTVQGVGFRSVIKRHAAFHDIKGFVHNLPDGSVEICAQGSADQINHFIHTIQSKPGSALILSIETKYKPHVQEHSSFEVR
jgi:acylphosphatase